MIPEKRHTVGGVDIGPRTELDRMSYDQRQMPLMGEVGDPQARRDFDYYPTPAWMTRALLQRLSTPQLVLEPCSGEGAIVDVLRAAGVPKVVTNDLDPSRPSDEHLDATSQSAWLAFEQMCTPAWVPESPLTVITNPPFNLADQIVPLAVNHANRVAMLLRLSWLEPTEARARFLALRPPTLLIVLPRHDFKGRGSTDSVTSAWMVWDDSGMRPGIEVVTKAERDELIALG